LYVADNLPQIGAKPRCIVAIERLESVRIAATNPFPKLVVVGHFYSHNVIRYADPKSSLEQQESLKETKMCADPFEPLYCFPKRLFLEVISSYLRRW